MTQTTGTVISLTEARERQTDSSPDTSALLDRARQGVRSARTLLEEAREIVNSLERIVADEDQAAENVAAAEARRGFRVVQDHSKAAKR
ncbi:MAG: hypothetical protein ACRDP6_36410 [Actinoallomurus sp.]